MRRLLALLSLFPLLAPAAENRPNVVLVFMDDMGYADVSAFGAKGYTTPNIDRLAAEGRKFTSFHVAQAVCSASRTALLTGCYPNRIGIHGALGPKSDHGINASEMTLAEVFKQKGYATACFGKWHLGHHEPFLPPNHGFDEYYGIPYSNDMWPRHPEARKGTYPPLPLIEGTKVVHSPVTPEDQKQFTQTFTERAVQFIEKSKDKPFFLYLPHPMVHVPLYASPAFEGKSGKGLFADVMLEIDWSMGRLMDTLKKHGLEENTLVIYTSDNGPWLSYGDHAGSSGPFREGKGTSWEGGKRVTCIMRWPAKIPAGTTSNAMLMTIDLLPTLAQHIGAQLPAHPIDGKDVLPLLTGPETTPNPHPYYAFYYAQNELQALVSGDGQWKLVFPHNYRTLAGGPGGKGGTPVKYDHARITTPELYNLHTDPSETTNVIQENPDIVAQLQAHATDIRTQLGDRLTQTQGNATREPGRIP
jgi:arylsulfatase A-like enzyme